MVPHNQINYIEIPVRDLQNSKAFFARVFGWQFTDHDGHYSCFSGAGINGGFYEDPKVFNLAKGAPLLVLFSDNLDKTQQSISNAGGEICKATYPFPGGKRFHFADPNGNEFAVWGSEK